VETIDIADEQPEEQQRRGNPTNQPRTDGNRRELPNYTRRPLLQ
jgi:hypothetical protein